LCFGTQKAQLRFAQVPRKIGFSDNGSIGTENFKNTDTVHSPDIRVQFEISSLTQKLNIRNRKRKNVFCGKGLLIIYLLFPFLFCLFNDTINKPSHKASNNRMMLNNGLERRYKGEIIA
jgi:hypothetical protein